MSDMIPLGLLGLSAVSAGRSSRGKDQGRPSVRPVLDRAALRDCVQGPWWPTTHVAGLSPGTEWWVIRLFFYSSPRKPMLRFISVYPGLVSFTLRSTRRSTLSTRRSTRSTLSENMRSQRTCTRVHACGRSLTRPCSAHLSRAIPSRVDRHDRPNLSCSRWWAGRPAEVQGGCAARNYMVGWDMPDPAPVTRRNQDEQHR